MSASIIFQILCFYFVLDDVSSECDRTNGPHGLTDCVFSPHEGKYQAAVCLDRSISSLNKHVTCTGENTIFCWYLCNTVHGHGGLSACHCDPASNTEIDNSILDKKCYLPTDDCSWFSKCLKKKHDCRSITDAENRCKKMKNLVKTFAWILTNFDSGWVRKVTSCIQRDLLHLLYPQIKSDCEKIRKLIDWSTNTCNNDPHSRRCDFSFADEFFLLLSFGYKRFSSHCKTQKFVPMWAELLVFYVKNDNRKDKTKLALEFGKELSKKFNWEKSGMAYRSFASETANDKSKLITIRIYLYSETKDSIQTKFVIDELKNYIEKGKMAELELEDKARVYIDHVISCITSECISKYFSYQTRTIACTLSGGYCRDDNTHRDLTCKKTKHGLCYQGKCCFPDKTGEYPCTEKGGWCQDSSLTCERYMDKEKTCGGSKLCCLPNEAKDYLCTRKDGTCQEKTLPCDRYEKRSCEGNQYCCLSHKGCTKVNIIKRRDWRAKEPRKITYLKDKYTPVSLFFIHHTVDDRCFNFEDCSTTVRNIQNFHMCPPEKCKDEAISLACKIKDSDKIELSTTNPSEVDDGADAYHNIEDACNGKQSKRSSYTCSEGTSQGGSVCLRSGILRYIYDLSTKHNLQVYVNAIAGGCHTSTSRHDLGEAVDLGPVNGPKRKKLEEAVDLGLGDGLNWEKLKEAYMGACEDAGGSAKEEGANVHCEIEQAWDDIGYSFLVGDDGNIYEGQGWSRKGIHTYGFNYKALGVAFIGDFTNQLPNNAAINAVKNLIQCGLDEGYISTDYKLLGHRTAGDYTGRTTVCPGDMLFNEIKNWNNFTDTLKP